MMKQLLDAHRIAVVGLSPDETKPSNGIAAHLIAIGREVVPVNPQYQEIFGLKCYARLEDVPGKVNLVNVFRRPQACADIARSAVAISAGGLWLQSGICNAEAKRICAAAGMPYVEDRCLGVEIALRR